MSGPLTGIKALEIAGIGPGPFCAMLLADMGADVLRLDRAASVRGTAPETPSLDLLARGRRSAGVDLKHPDGVATVLRLAESADVFMEGFRPGVMERLGLGPEVCMARNPGLIYARMTGWGQSGPLASAAGHDINYIALAGCLAHLGREGQKPTPPINLVGDFGGGGMLQALGIACALVSRAQTGKGQVVDTAMVDGTALLMTFVHGYYRAMGWSDARGTNLIDTGAHFYETYECSDGEFISLGAIEPQFYAELLKLVGLEGEELPPQMDRNHWPAMRERLAGIFRTKSRSEWCEIMEGSDACFAPVLRLDEAYDHPHNRARETFVEVAGIQQPAPAPRFSHTPGQIRRPPPHPGQHTDEALADWGLPPAEIATLRQSGAIA